MTVNEITSMAQFRELAASGKIFFIDFYANWCGPCRVISPVFEALAKDHVRDGIEFYKVNVDNVEELSQEVGIRAMPTFHVYRGGDKLGELVGADPSALGNLFKAHAPQA